MLVTQEVSGCCPLCGATNTIAVVDWTPRAAPCWVCGKRLTAEYDEWICDTEGNVEWEGGWTVIAFGTIVADD